MGMGKRAAIILDDDPVILKIVSMAFRLWGYEVEAYGNVGESPMATERHPSTCQAEAPCYDVLVTDNLMPGTSGLELLHMRRDAGCKIPRRILISGNLDADQAATAHALGCDVLAKPFSMEDLDRLLHGEPSA